jgi:uncharacterized Ntn-hydrolase superfamily protein
LTFSLIAKCPNSGQIGAITATKFLSAGAFMILGEPKVGICISQGFLNPLIRHHIISDLKNGLEVTDSLSKRLTEDSFPLLRQVLVMDWKGKTAVHSGHGCFEVVHSFNEDGIIAAGNVLPSAKVIDQMIDGYLVTEGSLAKKLLAALQHGHSAGGDKRGARSTALIVYDDEPYPVADLRVDDSEEPVQEMSRLCDIYFNEYELVTRRLPSLRDPIGTLGPVPKERLVYLASILKSRGEVIPSSWKLILEEIKE